MRDYSNYVFYPETGRKYYFLYVYLIGKAYLLNTFFPIDITVGTISRNNIARWFYMLEEGKDFKEQLETFVHNPNLLNQAKKVLKKSELTIKKKLYHDISELSNDELINKFNIFTVESIKAINIACIVRISSREIPFELKKILSEDEIQIASFPIKQDFVSRENLEIKKLATDLFSKSKTPSEKDVEEIHSEFCWVPIGYFGERIRSKQDYIDTLKNLLKDDPKKKLEELLERLKKERTLQKKLFEKYNDPLVKLTAEMVYLKDYFKESMNKIIFYSSKLFEEISKRTGKPEEYIFALTPDEIISLLKEKPIDEELVKNRDRHNVVISDNGEISVLVGAEADKFQERYVSKFYSYKNEFKGRVASKGYAKGKAKIVLKDTDFSKLKQGDILVVISTGPDYVPIMKKSAAIIAEEGSITSHVSVISREFRIPCIVGVDYITNILKDGDLVEVDADKGIIRKIK